MFNPFRTLRRLRKFGVLGMNRRNADYIMMYNKRRFYPLVDDKLKTKKLAESVGISVPELYGVVSSQRQVKTLPQVLRKFNDFVIKPAHGSGGEGILVVAGQVEDRFRKSSGEIIEKEELMFYTANILSGMFSLGGLPDRALIEYRINFDPLFDKITYLGVPDIRIIVFLGVPVMSMLRLPTKRSDGKANLHQGAIGVGVDVASGLTTSAVMDNMIIKKHPDTGADLAQLQIPGWQELLQLVAKCYDLTGLGYIGVDIALDKDLGPMILEMNARPGLNIQLANQQALLPRLQLVEKEHRKLANSQDKVKFAQDAFHDESSSKPAF